jgi:hypothetical protein
MMHGHEKLDHAAVAVKPANKAERPTAERSAAERNAAESGSQGRGPRGMRSSKACAGRSAGKACHRRWNVYGNLSPSHTRGGSRMRESRTYGSVRGARDETRVPTATGHSCCTCSRQQLAHLPRRRHPTATEAI